MSSFKVYLPSNACPNVYPNNSPTDFRIALDKPIELEGRWEVGVEGICYSSKIYDDAKLATINVEVERLTRPRINDLRPFRYHLSVNKKWLGFQGVRPLSFEMNPRKIDEVLNTLNSLNHMILKTDERAFHFQCDGDNILCDILDKGLFLRLSPRLAELLGSDEIIGDHTILTPTKHNNDLLNRDDYHVRYLHTALQEKATLMFRWYDSDRDKNVIGLRNMWKRTVTHDMYLDVKYGKTIILNNHDDLAIDFSPHMRETLKQPWPLIGNGSNQAKSACEPVNTLDINNGYWYVHVYSTEMVTRRHSTFKSFPLTLMPWKSNTIRGLLLSINHKVESMLKRKLKRVYHSQRHQFSLRLRPSQHITMRIGRRLGIKFSQNLAYLLGFPNHHFRDIYSHSEREVNSLFNRSRQLHILSNIVQPTAIGKQQVQVLCDFVHQRTKKNLSVKHFDTISYVPVMLNTIQMVHIQLVDDNLEPMKIRDMKSLITLYFKQS